MVGKQATIHSRAAGGAVLDAHDAAVQGFGFGPFRLDLRREQLHGPTGRHTLRPQLFATLRMLLEAAPAVVTLDQLLDRVWGRHALCPSAVPHVVAELRRALGDSARAPRYIETRHRRGYRIIPAVVRDLAAPPRAAVPPVLRPCASDAGDALLRLMDQWTMPSTACRRARLESLLRAASALGLSWVALQAHLALHAVEAELCAPRTQPGDRRSGTL
jgi:DNA-binding winged helix-turn-helix (wHTH) protein